MRFKLSLAYVATIAAIVAIPVVAFAGFAPSNRPTFQCITPTNCPGAKYVTFNSFTNAPNYGDERAFFDAKDATITSPGGYQDKLTVHDGQKIVMRAYIHNNANPKAIGEAAATAVNTRLQVLLPTSKKTSHVTAAQVTADNANPRTVSDTVDLSGARPFTIAFDKSAPVQVTYRPNGQGDFVTRALPGASFSNDYTLNANFGNMKGCFEYANLVTFTAIVKMERPQPEKPVYRCDALSVTAGSNRSINAKVSYTAESGAKLQSISYDFGDNSAPLVTDKTSVDHTYAKDGTYTVAATLSFKVGEHVKTARCSKQVTVTTPAPPVVLGKELPDTGPGSAVSMFAAVSAFAAGAHYVVSTRRANR